MTPFAVRGVTANAERQGRSTLRDVHAATRVSERPLRPALEATAALMHIALALVMAGTGDLAVLRRLRAVRRHHPIVVSGSVSELGAWLTCRCGRVHAGGVVGSSTASWPRPGTRSTWPSTWRSATSSSAAARPASVGARCARSDGRRGDQVAHCSDAKQSSFAIGLIQPRAIWRSPAWSVASFRGSRVCPPTTATTSRVRIALCRWSRKTSSEANRRVVHFRDGIAAC